MDPQIDARLKSIEEKLEKNHQILVRMRQVQRNGQLLKAAYWILIILLGLGAFYYVEPYIKGLMDVYSGFQDTQSSLQNSLPDIKNINTLIEQLKN